MLTLNDFDITNFTIIFIIVFLLYHAIRLFLKTDSIILNKEETEEDEENEDDDEMEDIKTQSDSKRVFSDVEEAIVEGGVGHETEPEITPEEPEKEVVSVLLCPYCEGELREDDEHPTIDWADNGDGGRWGYHIGCPHCHKILGTSGEL